MKNSWVGFQFYNRYLKKSGEVIGNSSFPFFVCYFFLKKKKKKASKIKIIHLLKTIFAEFIYIIY